MFILNDPFEGGMHLPDIFIVQGIQMAVDGTDPELIEQIMTNELDNLVERLDPEHVDPDLATELVRKNLNVAHPDEYVIEIEPTR